jgi:hypothetical protein
MIKAAIFIWISLVSTVAVHAGRASPKVVEANVLNLDPAEFVVNTV